ncbi:hypothetical protein GGI04_004452 [Coemansia thaxteri]|uniref:DUF605-domain-containing protein n=1 Tax=Coemansia thaxteri TaxID=2663907 RepID=A0A9W8EGP1_9FUNG|nr:hypothetical protein GGI04_004452 [Coemansia thaxteri]KAJ2006469.1 hypothetical protein H4R26_001346 [Coemansia thaxteri]KAJ2469857.1 hypothetical protein GGI02_003290 [Coemansia sp. RSA 2322]KAJ2484208.1 hypothetical protein EV174_002609 [Coemansia sp. RSA 2320]
MPPAPIPDELRLVAPYIQRAQEMAAVDPVVSYFCKYYAAQLAITSGANSGESQAYLSQLLGQLEAEKQQVGDNASMRDDQAAAAHCTSFALRVFAKADTEDREGRANKATARTFIVASQFLQVLASFGVLEGGVAEKIKYAKWRAAEILRAAREGRDPAANNAATLEPVGEGPSSGGFAPAGPPPVELVSAGPSSGSFASTGPSSGDILAWPSPPPPALPLSPPHQSAVYNTSSSVSMPHVPTSPISSNVSPAFIPVPAANLPPIADTLSSTDNTEMLDPVVARKAQKLARWAISALEYDDVSNAIENLREAIKVLSPYNKQP